jgi:hypothetical protein
LFRILEKRAASRQKFAIVKTLSGIIAGGGWIAVATTGKKRARFFGFLAAAWTPVSAFASLPFFEGVTPSYESTCAALLAIQALLVILALVHSMVEKPKPIISCRRDPGYDLRKLY